MVKNGCQKFELRPGSPMRTTAGKVVIFPPKWNHLLLSKTWMGDPVIHYIYVPSPFRLFISLPKLHIFVPSQTTPIFLP